MGTKQTTITEFRDGKAVDVQTINYTTTPEQDNEETIRAAAKDALAVNKAFVALASPSNAQVVAQVKAVSRQMNGLIRLVNNQLDGTD